MLPKKSQIQIKICLISQIIHKRKHIFTKYAFHRIVFSGFCIRFLFLLFTMKTIRMRRRKTDAKRVTEKRPNRPFWEFSSHHLKMGLLEFKKKGQRSHNSPFEKSISPLESIYELSEPNKRKARGEGPFWALFNAMLRGAPQWNTF